MGARSVREHDLAGGLARLLRQGVQTLTPRIFAASRFTRVSTPVLLAGQRMRQTRGAVELSGGYRLTQEWTLKGGYEAARRYGATDWAHAATCRSSGQSGGSESVSRARNVSS